MMNKIPLILILGIGDIKREDQEEMEILNKYKSMYSGAKIVYYKVDNIALSPIYKLSTVIYPIVTNNSYGFRLTQVIFDIGNTNNYIAAGFVKDLITAIEDKENSRYSYTDYHSDFYIGEYSIDNIIDDSNVDEHVGIYSTHPIGGCWYLCNNEVGFAEYATTKFSGVKDPLEWIGQSQFMRELYYDRTVLYYAIQLSAYNMKYPDRMKVIYTSKDGHSTCVGDVIDIDGKFSIIHLDTFPYKEYSQYNYFVSDIIDAKVSSSSSDKDTAESIQLITNKNYQPVLSKEEELKSLINDYTDRYIKFTKMMGEQKATMDRILELFKEKEEEG